MAQYRKKPVVVEATQWFKNGDHPNDYDKDRDGLEDGELRTFTGTERKAMGWEGDVVRYYRVPNDPGTRTCEHCAKTMHEHGWIDTLEGGHIVCPGDWIITGVAGERYPCKPSVFAESYAPAGESNQGLPVAGYRPQSDKSVEMVNANKQAEERLLRLIDSLDPKSTLFPKINADPRWLAIARTQLEQGFMALNRAIFKPTRAKLPEDVELPPAASPT